MVQRFALESLVFYSIRKLTCMCFLYAYYLMIWSYFTRFRVKEIPLPETSHINLRNLKRRLACTPIIPASSNGTLDGQSWLSIKSWRLLFLIAVIICAWVNTCLASCDSPLLLQSSSRFVEMLYCLSFACSMPIVFHYNWK